MACKQIVDHDCRPETRTGFDADIQVGSLGDLNLVQFHNSPMLVAYTAAHVSHTRSDDLFVCRQASGQVIIEQDAREVLLDMGPLNQGSSLPEPVPENLFQLANDMDVLQLFPIDHS